MVPDLSFLGMQKALLQAAGNGSTHHISVLNPPMSFGSLVCMEFWFLWPSGGHSYTVIDQSRIRDIASSFCPQTHANITLAGRMTQTGHWRKREGIKQLVDLSIPVFLSAMQWSRSRQSWCPRSLENPKSDNSGEAWIHEDSASPFWWANRRKNLSSSCLSTVGTVPLA